MSMLICPTIKFALNVISQVKLVLSGLFLIIQAYITFMLSMSKKKTPELYNVTNLNISNDLRDISPQN